MHSILPLFSLTLAAFVMLLPTVDAAAQRITTVTNITPDLNNQDANTAGKKVDRAFVYGFELSLKDEHLETTPAFGKEERVELSSLSIMNRSKPHPRINRFIDPLKVAIYTTDHRLVGISQDTMPANAIGQLSTVHFANTFLETQRKYKFVFVDGYEVQEGMRRNPPTLPRAVRYGMEFYAVQGALSLYRAEEGPANLQKDMSQLELGFPSFMPVITIRTKLSSPESGNSQPSSAPASTVKSAGKSTSRPAAKANWVTEAESSQNGTTTMLVLVLAGLALLVLAFLTLWRLTRK